MYKICPLNVQQFAGNRAWLLKIDGNKYRDNKHTYKKKKREINLENRNSSFHVFIIKYFYVYCHRYRIKISNATLNFEQKFLCARTEEREIKYIMNGIYRKNTICSSGSNSTNLFIVAKRYTCQMI